MPHKYPQSVLFDESDIARSLAQMANHIALFAGDVSQLVLVGIHRRGVELAARLAKLLEATHGQAIPTGALDITLYRDDFQTVGPIPVVGATAIPVDLADRSVVIVDDVLFTGRTIRAALDELRDFGRPARIGLAVLVDRGGRELPIQADIVGQRVSAGQNDHVDVNIAELDGTDVIYLVKRGQPQS